MEIYRPAANFITKIQHLVSREPSLVRPRLPHLLGIGPRLQAGVLDERRRALEKTRKELERARNVDTEVLKRVIDI